MGEVFIVEAVRSPLGKRGGGLSTVHPADLLGAVQKAAVERAKLDPAAVDQIIGGCVSQVGEQAFNVARTAWLSAGMPLEVPSTTVDSQCGSSQQASTLAAGLVGSGLEDVVLSCGVESMSRVPLGANFADKKLGRPVPKSYFARFAFHSQFQGAELIAKEFGISRDDTDRFGLRSQELAKQAWDEKRFEREVVPLQAPVVNEAGEPTGELRTVARDEGLRETTLEKLATLKAVMEGGVHTAGSSSQITDGASAVLLASEAAVKRLGLRPRARIVYSTIVGVEPETMLKGPIPVTKKLLDRTGLALDQMDVFEVNEAFASVVLAWQKAVGANPERVNPNGGAIALGHPTGATGDRLITTALHELERTGGRYALVAMCCGGGLGTGTILERLG
ncbi:MAG TPA: steroid 3-ketoacyl-CoA thiolase [Myxococcota bacterium]|jgi:acetyl-CoA C-acetyltransferase|nr:steroid 3-ketoacyl-CoA thiolase [Myxococcota bacterium]